MSERIPEATVARLPVYHRVLTELSAAQVDTVSSERLAQLSGVTAAKVRKDLSQLGSYGTRGVGYEVRYLLFAINDALGLDHDWPVIVAGAGNLGQALANYRGFAERGFPIVAFVDTDPAKVGGDVQGIPVVAPGALEQLVADHPGCIGVVATPAEVAQGVVDRLVEAGVRSILNFAPALVHAPDDVFLRKVDLSLEMQILTFYAHRAESEPTG